MKCIELLPSFVVIYPRNWCQYTKSCHKFKSFKISYFKQKLCISKFTLYMGQILFSSYIVHLKSAFFLWMRARTKERKRKWFCQRHVTSMLYSHYLILYTISHICLKIIVQFFLCATYSSVNDNDFHFTKTDLKIHRFKLCVSFCTALEHSHA